MGATEADTGAGRANDVNASVIVCVFSSQRLEQAIACVQSVVAQRPAPAQVIVSVDHNDDLLIKLRARVPQEVEVVSNDGLHGLSSARNTALRLSRGDLIVFIDDDAVAHKRWLTNLLAAFNDPRVVGAGGHAVPAWAGEQPAWFPDEFLWVVGCSYRGLPASGPVRNPLGCNMAFRGELFKRAGTFDPGIGRLGSRPLGCEETEFCIRAAQVVPDGRLVMVSGAEVDHNVPRERERPGYFLRRCYHEGISKALVRKLGDARSLGTERAYVGRTLVALLRRAVWASIVGPARSGALGQIGAVVGGVAAAATGYLVGTIAFRNRRAQASPDAQTRDASRRADLKER